MKVAIWLFIAMLVTLIGLNFQPARTPQPSSRATQTTYFITIDSEFTPEIRSVILDALTEYERVGVHFRVINYQRSDLQIKNWYNRANNRIGEYNLNSSTVFIDTTRLTTKTQLRALSIHEVGHFLGMWHICEYPGEDVDCSQIGQGTAIMNPILYSDHIVHLSDLDLIEFNRTRRRVSRPHTL